MKNNSFLLLLLGMLLGLFSIENADASVYVKNESGKAAVNQLITQASLKNSGCAHRKELKILPFGNVAIWGLKWKLRRWLTQNVNATKVSKKSHSGCYELVKNNGVIHVARQYRIQSKSIVFQLAEQNDSTWYTIPVMETRHLVGLNDKVRHGPYGSDFEYFSIISLASLFVGLVFFALGGPLTLIVGGLLYLNSIVFGIMSLFRLARHGYKYDKIGLAYFLSIFSLVLSVLVPLIFIGFVYLALGG